jgi:hypothetical protein
LPNLYGLNHNSPTPPPENPTSSSVIRITRKEQITDSFLINQGKMLFDNSKTGHQLFFERMRKDMDQYDGKFQSDERKYSDILGVPRLFIPKTFVNTQRIAVDVLESIFFDPEEIVDVKVNKEIPMDHIRLVKTILNHRLNGHPIDFYQEAYEATINAVRNMICVFKVWPQVETEIVTIQKLMTKELEDGTPYQTYVDAKEKRIKYFEPRIECVPPEDVLFSKRATWKNYFKYPLIHRYRKTRSELRLLGYKNVNTVPEVHMEDQLNDVVKYQRRQDYQTLFNDATDVQDQEEVWVFEYWDYLPDEDGKLKGGSYILLGDQLNPTVVGRGWVENDLPYRFSPFEHNRPPIILGEAYPEPHRLEGKSYPQITEALQKETNAQRNQEREAIARDLRRTMYINRDSNVDLLALTNRRIGSYVLGDGPAAEAMQEIPTNNSAAILARTQARTDNDYAETGLPPLLQGQDQPGDQSATESTQQLTNANKKIALVIKNMAYTAFLPIFRYLLRLEQAYETEDYIKAVAGKYMGPLIWDQNMSPRSVIQGDFDLQVNIAVNKQAQINKFFLIMDRANQANQATGQLVQMRVLPAQQATFIDPVKIFKEILPLVGIKKNNEFDLQAMTPPPEEGQGGAQPSPTGQILDTNQQTSNMVPGAPGLQ